VNGRPDVLFIHGAGGGGWEWRTWREVFDAYGWETYAPDLKPAEGGLAATTLNDYVRQVEAFTMARETLILVGASMGGLLALKAANTASPAALVLLNSIPPAGTPGWPPRDVHFPDVIPWASQTTLEDTRETLADADDDTVRWAQNRWRDESGAVMRALYAGVPVDPPSIPMLVINGGADTQVPPETGAAMAERWDGDLLCAAGVTHVGALLGRRAALIAELTCTWLENTALE
jgi:pimeloyl-ACP methyl ester carboxylesterase